MTTPEWIAQRVRDRRYRLTLHAEEERDSDGITVVELEAAFSSTVEVLEDYPNDLRGPSCLAMGTALGGQVIHAVIGAIGSDVAVFSTMYRPAADRWIDGRRRKDRSTP